MRLRNLQLAGPTFHEPGQLVSWMGAVQAQDYPGAKWALGQRLPGSTDDAVEAALAERAFVRTWMLRGTLHFVAADDLGWMLSLIAPRVISSSVGRMRQLELSEATLARTNRLLLDALQDEGPLKRKELFERVERAGISTQEQRGIHMLSRASLEGLIVQIGQRRNQAIYVPAAEFLARSPRLGRPESVLELARRYFTSHGPAALQDFTTWSGLPLGEARPALEALKPGLDLVKDGDRELWFAPSDPAVQLDPPVAYLLPAYDELMIGYRDRSAALPPEYAGVLSLANGLSPAIAIGGRICGIWTRSFQKGTTLVRARFFRPLEPEEEQAFDRTLQGYSAFLGMPVKRAETAL